MLFFGRKRSEKECSQAAESLEAGLREVKESLKDVLKRAGAETKAAELGREAVQETARQVGNLEERQKELERQIRRQSDSFEDLLEEIQQERSDKESLRQERRENSRKEQALISLVMCCAEQMDLLEKQIQGDDSMAEGKRAAWRQQFCTMALERLKFMRACGLEEAGEEGEQVDYSLHEILSVVETEDKTKAGTVARVYSRGFLHGGRIIKKARVAAYKQPDSQNETLR